MLNHGKSLLSRAQMCFSTRMDGQNIQNGTENGQNQPRKTTINFTTDEMVGLLLEWAKVYSLPEWMERMIENMQAKYDSIDDQPTEEEKIDFINTFVWGIPNGFFIKDIALRFLRNYGGEAYCGFSRLILPVFRPVLYVLPIHMGRETHLRTA